MIRGNRGTVYGRFAGANPGGMMTTRDARGGLRPLDTPNGGNRGQSPQIAPNRGFQRPMGRGFAPRDGAPTFRYPQRGASPGGGGRFEIPQRSSSPGSFSAPQRISTPGSFSAPQRGRMPERGASPQFGRGGGGGGGGGRGAGRGGGGRVNGGGRGR
jgi:hypothetical protein